jgi:hypothetical protein
MAGFGAAAKRLGDIFAEGKGGVDRDYASSQGYYFALAKKMGVDLPVLSPPEK